MATNDLFMDSSGFYAALDARDSSHQAAAVEITKAVKSGGKLIFTDYIITESLNLAVARRGHHVAGRMLDFLEESNAWNRISVDAAFFDEAVLYFRKHRDKNFSFTDCTSFVVMKSLCLTRLRKEDGGNWYHCADLKIDGWLCPALHKYFKTAPASLYVKVQGS